VLTGPLGRGTSVACGLALAGVVTGCAAEPSSEVAVREFLLAWQEGDYEQAAQRTTGDVEEVAQVLHDFHDHLDLVSLRLDLGPITRDGDTAQASFEAVADLGIGDPVWNFEGQMDLSRIDGRWTVEWSPNVVHPVLDDGERLAVTYEVPERGQILDHEGERLVDTTEVVAFGVRPAEMPDLDVGVSAFANVLEEDAEPLLSRVRSAPPEEFQPLVLMRAEDADSDLIDQVGDITGAETHEHDMLLAPRHAPSVIGEVAGTDEHNIADRVAGAYQAGDTVGLSGLQAVYQQRLAGTATTHIVTLDAEGNQVDLVQQWPGEPSGTIETTLDAVLQEAAASTLASAAEAAAVRRASLVALDAESGEIRAAATHPGGLDDHHALTAEYAAGNAFTIISTAAMLRSGVDPEEGVGCVVEQEVGDYTFANNSGPQLWGEAAFAQVFANSCTNGFVSVAENLDDASLEEAAADFGIGAEWDLPIETYAGEFEPASGDAGRAAAAVGEDGVTVSPLSMAVAAGAVADGTRRAPTLVTSPARDAEQPDEVSIDEQTVEPLRELMRASVEQGSASGVNVGEIPVHGQAATVARAAEDDGLVQWFVGYQGALAFAVAVEVDPDYAYLATANNNQFAVSAVSRLLLGLPQGHITPTAAQEEQMEDDLEGQGALPGQETGQEGQQQGQAQEQGRQEGQAEQAPEQEAQGG
jgi:cell division protein FtsI/penicillin-binding protein 2